VLAIASSSPTVKASVASAGFTPMKGEIHPGCASEAGLGVVAFIETICEES